MAAPNKNKPKTPPPATVQNFPIVGIGASAGGLDAFKRLLTVISENSGMAYVVVQHLDPTHESVLPEILQRVTKIPVHEITDDIHLAPNHIYIIPSNKILTSTDGVLQLTTRDKNILNLCIDIFFKSLAEVHKEFAVGVVLSGTGSDGTLGLKAIKENGGISIVQDSESSTYDSMPQSAIKAGVVDFVLSPEDIPAHLLQICNSYESNHFFKEAEEIPKDEDYIYKQILLLLRQRSGVDFTYYKQPTFHRRIARRIAILKKKNLFDYLKYLRIDKAEQDALFQDVLIPVTSFFRDPKTFYALAETVFPAIVKNKNSDETIRIWIAGCSTGEEAYSIAICLHEYLALSLLKIERTKIQIFASDISEKAIKKARTAFYTIADVEKLSEIQIKNYFTKINGGYEVSKLIRDMCVFTPHNFLKDPPFAKIDLITCRNVLIYMDNFLQKKVFTTFHYALKENGFLLLGKSETTGASSDLFTQVSKSDKIYSRTALPGRFMHVLKEGEEETSTKKNLYASQTGKPFAKNETVHADFRRSAEEIMILKSPASVVVNEQMDIVHIHGDITPFLQVPQGKPTHNLIKMAREGLAFELRNVVHKAMKEKSTITKENIPVKANEKQTLVTVEIIPLTDTIEPYYLIRFEEKIISFVVDEKNSSSRKLLETQKIIAQLEKELSQTREDMRSITEDMEAANEELQSANEELQSSNEEMQSLNEELETSQEELQSTNEELIIVNQEFLDKQEQLNISYAEQEEARKQIESSEKVQKKLASQLKLATDSAKIGIWSLDIKTQKLEWSNLHKELWGFDENRENLTYEDWHKVIFPEDKELAFQRIEESKVANSIYDVDYRITRANDGAIVWIKSTGQYYYDDFGTAHTLTGISMDITKNKEAEEKLRASEEIFKSIFDNSLAAVLVSDDKGNYLSANEAASELFGYSVDELLQMNVGDLQTTKQNGAAKRYEEYMRKGKESGEFEYIAKNGVTKFSKFKASRIKADFNLIVLMDISNQKLIDEEMSKALIKAESATEIAENAVKIKQQFLSNMSHEIRTPMNAIIGFTKVLSKTDLTEKQNEYLQAIKTSGDTLIVLINDILDLAKVDAGKMIFTNSPFKISNSITTILHLFEIKMQEKNLELVKEFDSKIPEVVLGDSIRLHQILINLLSNAIKFTEKGKITVIIKLLKEEKEKVKIEISISDTGIGIPQNKITSIFENFEQAHAITSSLYGGTGLGLAIVKQLVEKQGGTILVRSKEDEGSTFSFTLSFQKTNAVIVIENEDKQYKNEINPIKVLIVEDVKLNQLLLRTILDDFKFTWDMADNGEIAVEKLKTNSYDIILMDLQMPIMNGFEATEFIRNNLKLKTPIIALTADVTTADVDRCKAVGMNDYISKPIDEKLLYSKILNLIKAK